MSEAGIWEVLLSGDEFGPITAGHVERGRARVGGLCYSGVKILSDIVVTVNVTMVEFIRDRSSW